MVVYKTVYTADGTKIRIKYASSDDVDAWIISGCTLYQSVSLEYCKESCKLGSHCSVWMALHNEEKEQVQFT